MRVRAGGQESFARREVVASAGLWERGAEASGTIPPSARLLPVRALKADATSPSGETAFSTGRAPTGKPERSPSLDRHASSVSPRQHRHGLRRAAGCILPEQRVATCGQKAVGQVVTFHMHEGQAHLGGIETCSSVWTCPVCAVRITEGRRADIETVLSGHENAVGRAYMATLTIPHHRFQKCRDLRRAVTEAWRRVKSGKSWIAARAGYGWIGDIRALEVTHGQNGWHPHLHILILFRPGVTDPACLAFGSWLFDRWARAIARLGYGQCSEDAFTFSPVNMAAGAADYVSKWGVSLELTKAHVKRAGNGGRTPWQILEDFARSGSRPDRELFREYARAFKGARQLTWSRGWTGNDGDGAPVQEPGLRERYLAEPEVPDEELATPPTPQETHVASMDRDLFNAVVRLGKTAEVISAYEENGLQGLLDVLRGLGIRCRVSPAPSLEPLRYVPIVSRELPWDVPYPCQSRAWETFNFSS